MSDEPNKGGRPVEWTDERIQEEADALEAWIDEDVPGRVWIKDFAIKQKDPADYLHKWAKRHDGFNRIYARAKDVCESRLANSAITTMEPGRLGFAGLMLKCNYGWSEKDITQHVGPDDGPLRTINVNIEAESLADMNAQAMKELHNEL